jgi:YegS/Rv2252/BmrU family lipid kinase
VSDDHPTGQSRPASGDDVVLVVNPASGGGRGARVAPKVRAALEADGWRVDPYLTKELDDARRLTMQVPRGHLVVVVGGDGLIGRAAEGAVASGALFAPLPAGRGNDFCRTLRIPLDPVRAAQGLRRASVRAVDVGTVNLAGATHTFVCVVSLGFDSVANEIANNTSMLSGTAVYLYAALKAMATWRPATFTIEADGEQRIHTGWTVAVGNCGQYGGGMRICPDAQMDDGLLDVTLVGAVSKASFLATLPKVFSGRHLEHPMVDSMRVTSMHVDADRPFGVYADGERLGELPARITTMPGALQVLVSEAEVAAGTGPDVDSR